MRKTVHEWLETHQQGQGMAKKESLGKKPKGLPTSELSGATPKKKALRKKAKRKPR